MIPFASAEPVILPFLSLAIGVVGLAGLMFTALRYRRDDTTAVVTQQSTILDNMKSLNEELRTSTENMRQERDALRVEVQHLTGQVEMLRTELHEAHAQMSGKMSRIERKLDDG